MKHNAPEGFERFLDSDGVPDVYFRPANQDEYTAFVEHIKNSPEFSGNPNSTITVDKAKTYVVKSELGDQMIAANAFNVELDFTRTSVEPGSLIPPGVKDMTSTPVLASLSTQDNKPVVKGSTQDVVEAWNIQYMPEPLRASAATKASWEEANEFVDPEGTVTIFLEASNGVRETMKLQELAKQQELAEQQESTKEQSLSSQAQSEPLKAFPNNDPSPPSGPEPDGGARKFLSWQAGIDQTRQELMKDIHSYEATRWEKKSPEELLKYQQDKFELARTVSCPEDFVATNKGERMRLMQPGELSDTLKTKNAGEFMSLHTVTGAGIVANVSQADIANSEVVRDSDKIYAAISVKNNISEDGVTNLYVVEGRAEPDAMVTKLYLAAERLDGEGNVLSKGEKALEEVGIDRNDLIESISLKSRDRDPDVNKHAERFASQISPEELRRKISASQIQQQVQRAQLDTSRMPTGGRIHVSADANIPEGAEALKPHIKDVGDTEKMELEAANRASKVFVRSLTAREVEVMNTLNESVSNTTPKVGGAALISKTNEFGRTSNTYVLQDRSGGRIESSLMSEAAFSKSVITNDPYHSRAPMKGEWDVATESPTMSMSDSFSDAMDVMSKAYEERDGKKSNDLLSAKEVIATLKKFCTAGVMNSYEENRAKNGYRDQSELTQYQAELAQIEGVKQQLTASAAPAEPAQEVSQAPKIGMR